MYLTTLVDAKSQQRREKFWFVMGVAVYRRVRSNTCCSAMLASGLRSVAEMSVCEWIIRERARTGS